MKIKWIRNTGMGFLGLLELLVVASIILFLAYKMYNGYFRRPIADRQTEKMATEQGIDTTSAKTVLDSTKQKLQAISQQFRVQEKELEKTK